MASARMPPSLKTGTEKASSLTTSTSGDSSFAFQPNAEGRVASTSSGMGLGFSGSNFTHRLADLGRSVLSKLTPKPSQSNFIAAGTLTPEEFVDAGDLLVHRFPTWQWCGAPPRRANSWLPPEKQFLLTKGVACHKRVKDIELALSAQAREDEGGWLLPLADEDSPPPVSLQAASGQISLGLEGGGTRDKRVDGLIKSSEGSEGAVPELSALDFSSVVEEEEDSAAAGSERYFVRQAPDADIVSTRTYDLSVTYDTYFQTPRLWLFGYDENGVPLRPNEIFEDVFSDYVSKTVTVDPHPVTGIPTASIHPCKHAQVMRKVVSHWRSHGVEPRQVSVCWKKHDLAVLVLLKFIASVIPTIEYDYTMDVDMGLCSAEP